MKAWKAIERGGRAALADALSMIESDALSPSSRTLLDHAWKHGRGHGIGLTGSPGAGKSTLIGAMLPTLSRRSAAVLAVDPSSQASGGALLGDRIRFDADPDSDRIFIRSMAARDRLGGVAGATLPAAVLLRALYDWVIIETVGVGQSETDIAGVADTVVLCAVPGAGDTLQWMKSGIAEIPDIIVITKSDQRDLAQRTLADVRSALAWDEDRPAPTVQALSARTGEGVPELIQAIENHGARAAGRRDDLRIQGISQWARFLIQSRFGERGLDPWRDELDRGIDDAAPFSRIAAMVEGF